MVQSLVLRDWGQKTAWTGARYAVAFALGSQFEVLTERVNGRLFTLGDFVELGGLCPIVAGNATTILIGVGDAAVKV